jgi:hypothetical protein
VQLSAPASIQFVADGLGYKFAAILLQPVYIL